MLPKVVSISNANRGKSDLVTQKTESSYYGVPVIHKPHWKWLIIVYFFLGGISGASYVIASLAHLFGPNQDRRIARAGRYLSFATLLPCPVLLVLDLGQPKRFLNMLRIVKFRSPMSVGTWGLLLFSAFSTASTVVQAAQDGLLGQGRAPRLVAALPARGIAATGTPFGFFLAGYTGVLLGATAVPLWAKNALLLGPLFLSSALSTATSAITLLLAVVPGTDRATLERLERLERITLATELGLLAASRANLGPTAKPLLEGRTGQLMRYGTVGAGLVVPLLLNARPQHDKPGRRRARTALTSLLVLGGGFILRYAVVVAGNASADDPQATFEMTRIR
jgi:formate-dependent nitrite reductase membrane component NrfD